MGLRSREWSSAVNYNNLSKSRLFLRRTWAEICRQVFPFFLILASQLVGYTDKRWHCNRFSGEQLNFFKFSLLILDEFPRTLRQTFKTMWDNTYGGLPGFQLWDDSTAVRNLFATTEGGKTKVPIHQSYNEWDCTNLFQATIFAQSFASSASTGSYTTLSDFYVKPRAVPHGSFHACVLSRGGNNEETFALAIDQLRRLRNSLCHSISSKMDKLTFHQRVSYTRDAFLKSPWCPDSHNWLSWKFDGVRLPHEWGS